ncbi:MAG: cytochrome c oxidase subunit II [Acidobacteria bacterium]|nr:MAG: cytochrome c oxidase subunit II [Acidobacteriota bacterium]
MTRSPILPFLPFPIFPEEASTLAGRTDHLLFFLLGLSGFMTAIIAFLILWFGIRYRRRPDNERATQVHGSYRLEIAWSVVPLLIFMVAYAWGASVYFWAYTPPPDALAVYGVGKQWMWKFQHLSGQREINELHVPVARPVKVLLTSQDVIHSFFVPEFRVKQDAIPGLTIPIWFIPNVTTAEMREKTGNPNFQYEIACAQLCGLGHYRMRGFVTVLSAEEFQKWMDDEEAKLKELDTGGANPFAQ